MVSKKKYSRRRRRYGGKSITSGGSYPLYRGGRYGGAGPYFITVPEQRQEIQYPPQFLDYMKTVTDNGKGVGNAIRAWAGPISQVANSAIGISTLVAPQATAKFFENQRQKASAGRDAAKADAAPAKQEEKKRKRQANRDAKAQMEKEDKQAEFTKRGQDLLDDAKTLQDMASDIKDTVTSVIPTPTGPHLRSTAELYESLGLIGNETTPNPSWPYNTKSSKGVQIDPSKVGRYMDFGERWIGPMVAAPVVLGRMLSQGRR